MADTTNILRKFLIYGDRTNFWPVKKDLHRLYTIMAAVAHRLPLRFIAVRGARHTSLNKSAAATQGKAMVPIAKSNHGKAAACLPPLLDKTTASQVGFLQEQISRHLRVISEVNSLTYFTTTAVSEPPLSLTVASLLRGKGPNACLQSSEQWSDVVEILAEAQKTVGLMLGEEGEECVRLLCSFASDQAAAHRVECAFSSGVTSESELAALTAQCDPICLADWLSELLGHDGLPEQLLPWSSTYYLNFTHYFELSEWVVPGQMGPMILVEGWWRQVAFYGSANQPGWDLLIPIYQSKNPPNLSDYFRPSHLSYVTIQVKNRMSDVAATEQFGPSCCTDAANADCQVKTRDECLEIFIDLCSPVVKLHPYKQATRAPNENSSRYHHLVVSGWSVEVFGVVEKLSAQAREHMCQLFDLTESQREHSIRKLRASNTTLGMVEVRQFHEYAAGCTLAMVSSNLWPSVGWLAHHLLKPEARRSGTREMSAATSTQSWLTRTRISVNWSCKRPTWYRETWL